MKIYRYLTGKDDVNFCARVTKALNEGYELYETVQGYWIRLYRLCMKKP